MGLFSVHIRDANNVPQPINGLYIKICDMGSQPLEQLAVHKALNDVVADAYHHHRHHQQSQHHGSNEEDLPAVVSVDNYELQFDGCLFIAI